MSGKEKTERGSKATLKFFAPWQDEKREEWLESMSLRGWHLRGVNWSGCAYRFMKGESLDYTYRLDFKASSDDDLAAYLAIFSEAGWEYVGRDVTWKYFRREKRSALKSELYSDGESKADRYRNLRGNLSLAGLIFLALTLGFAFLTLGLLTFVNRFFWALAVWAPVFLSLSAAAFFGTLRVTIKIRRIGGPTRPDRGKAALKNKFSSPLIVLLALGTVFAVSSALYFLSFPEISGRFDVRSFTDLSTRDFADYDIGNFSLDKPTYVELTVLGKGVVSKDVAFALIDAEGARTPFFDRPGGQWGRAYSQKFEVFQKGDYRVILNGSRCRGIVVCLIKIIGGKNESKT